jgi:hypothetical protein
MPLRSPRPLWDGHLRLSLVRALGVFARKSGANNGNRYASDPYSGRPAKRKAA